MIGLERRCGTAAHWSEAQYRGLAGERDDSTARIALIASRPGSVPEMLGFLVARHVAHEWEVENIVVTPEERRKGIGTRLLHELLARAQQRDGEPVFLEVRESNAAARALYEKMGFRESGRRKGYYANPQEDAVLYCRQPNLSPVSE